MSESQKRPGIVSTIFSVIAAFFGVQSESNRQRDFKHGSPLAYIIVGIILATVMVFGLIGLVNWVLAASSGQ
jgi:prolipoprotein diacylglyceryltransferase